MKRLIFGLKELKKLVKNPVGGGPTCVKHIPVPFKFSPIFINRATCVAHDKNLSPYRLNVLETDKTPSLTLSWICSTLTEFRQSCYATIGSICSLSGLVLLRPSANSLSRGEGKGFTLAEVLITLGIIGVVAAIILSSVISNAQNKQYEAGRKRIHYNIREAVKILQTEDNFLSAPDTKDFVENYLSKKLSIAKTCEVNKMKNCGIETDSGKVKSLAGTNITLNAEHFKYLEQNGTVYAATLNNGNSLNIFYNPNCTNSNTKNSNGGYFYTMNTICMNVVYDLNGLAKPNQVGKDIGFVTTVYTNGDLHVVAPNVYNKRPDNTDFYHADSACKALDKDLTVPDMDELIAIGANWNKLISIEVGPGIWSSQMVTEGYRPNNSDYAYNFTVGNMYMYKNPATGSAPVVCIKK